MPTYYKLFILFIISLILSSCSNGNFIQQLTDSIFVKSHPYSGFTSNNLEATVSMYRTEPIIMNLNNLQHNKTRLQADDKHQTDINNRLMQQARFYYNLETPTIIHKPQIHQNQTPNDYVSMGIYWWPNPNTANGLPYVRRDGEKNPESDKLDFPKLNTFVVGSTTLTLAWYMTEDEQYANRAIEYVETWFCNPRTRMNPHLRFSQGVPGRSEGRGSGIVDTYLLPEVIDAIYLLRNFEGWNSDVDICLQDWFSSLLDWMINSDLGLEEANANNNHGTWYDAQVVAYATFIGRNNLAQNVIVNSVKKRINSQINREGRQPLEMRRARGVDYSTYNLYAYSMLNRYAQLFDVDLLGYTTNKSGGIISALEFLNGEVTRQSESLSTAERLHWHVLRPRFLQNEGLLNYNEKTGYINRFFRELTYHSYVFE